MQWLVLNRRHRIPIVLFTTKCRLVDYKFWLSLLNKSEILSSAVFQSAIRIWIPLMWKEIQKWKLHRNFSGQYWDEESFIQVTAREARRTLKTSHWIWFSIELSTANFVCEFWQVTIPLNLEIYNSDNKTPQVSCNGWDAQLIREYDISDGCGG